LQRKAPVDNIILYDGDVELVFDRRAHGYKRNGIKVPSVTTILGVISKPALLGWAVNETLDHVAQNWRPGRVYSSDEIQDILTKAKESRHIKSKGAMDVGKSAHEWIESYIEARANGNEREARVPDHPLVRSSVQAFLNWEKAHHVEYLHSERRIYSKSMNYSGTVDLVALVDGRITVIDFKTSKAIYNDYFLQVAAYAYALHEEGVIEEQLNDIDLLIIHIPKDGSGFGVGHRTGETEKLARLFMAAVVLYEFSGKKD
jgi:hypothetical protein